MTEGPLALVGGAEFMPGNEPQDEVLVRAARELPDDRPAFIIATAAARYGPEKAVATARSWFAALGLPVEELQLRTRTQAMDASTAELATHGRFFYLCGGDPGLVVTTLAGTPAWAAMYAAWRDGAALGGSSAGAMALGEWTLIRDRMPGDDRRQPRAALAVVPGVAVLPHYETFGHRWVASALEALGEADAVLLGIDERSAAVWDAGRWTVSGPGGVTVIRGGDPRRFEPGRSIEGLPTPT